MTPMGKKHLPLICLILQLNSAPEKCVSLQENTYSNSPSEHFFDIISQKPNLACNAIIGHVTISTKRKALHIDEICVEEQYQRQGFGSASLNKIFEIATNMNTKKLPAPKINQITVKASVAAVGFYEKNGYIQKTHTVSKKNPPSSSSHHDTITTIKHLDSRS